MDHGQRAMELFQQGYNCAQAVLLAFSDLTCLEEETALKLAASFGGGMGRLREVCGAVSGMFMAAGLLYGSADPNDGDEKKAHYARIQALAGEFREKNGSYICRELLSKVPTTQGSAPEARSEAYYKKRPCALLCRDAAEILDAYLAAHPL